jgi:hypothetical protein
MFIEVNLLTEMESLVRRDKDGLRAPLKIPKKDNLIQLRKWFYPILDVFCLKAKYFSIRRDIGLFSTDFCPF